MIDEPPRFDFPPYCLAFYEVSVQEVARLAVGSFMAFGECIEAENAEAEAAGYLYAALSHCAAISRYFWPARSSSKLAKQRGELLRQRYAVDEDSPLANRDLRNALEHFDERLDEWILSGPVGPIIASPILADQQICQDEFGHIFKLIDWKSDVFVILGKKFYFGALSLEVSRILMADK